MGVHEILPKRTGASRAFKWLASLVVGLFVLDFVTGVSHCTYHGWSVCAECRVVDAESGQPIQGVRVSECHYNLEPSEVDKLPAPATVTRFFFHMGKGTSYGFITQHFLEPTPPLENYSFLFEAEGYLPKRVPATSGRFFKEWHEWKGFGVTSHRLDLARISLVRLR